MTLRARSWDEADSSISLKQTKKMKIGIDIRSTLKKKRTGIGNYTLGLIKALALADSDNSYFLYSRIRPFDLKKNVCPLPGRNFRHRIERLSFFPERAMKDMDIFHTSSYDIPAPGTYRLFTTVHDLVPLFFEEGYSGDYLRDYRDIMERVLRESSVVITDSENTRDDVREKFPGLARRVEVVYPGVDISFTAPDNGISRARVKKKYGLEGRYALYSGGMDPRKNLTRLVEAFRVMKSRIKAPCKLLITGEKAKFPSDAGKKITEYSLADDIVFTGYVGSEDLKRLYAAADVFVYPSLYEGFGLPILEAFAMGTPVVTSSTSSCGEIASGAAVTVDPLDSDALAEALYNVVSDKDLAAHLKERGKERAEHFSWEKSAGKLLDLFRESAPEK